MKEPNWVAVARKYEGVREIPGKKSHPRILDLLDIADGTKDGKYLQGISNDDVPWCASYVSGVLEEAGIPSAKSAWARSYLNWGVKLKLPAVGAVVVFERGPKSGHVGFVVARTPNGRIVVLGGNQSDMVNESAFPTSRVLGYRWPKEQPLPVNFNLPTRNAQASKSEA